MDNLDSYERYPIREGGCGRHCEKIKVPTARKENVECQCQEVVYSINPFIRIYEVIL